MTAPAGGQAQRRTAGGGLAQPLNLIHRNNSPEPVSTRVSGVLAMPKDSWQKGYDDGLLGITVCPFSVASVDAWAWSSGVIEGRAARANSKP